MPRTLLTLFVVWAVAGCSSLPSTLPSSLAFWGKTQTTSVAADKRCHIRERDLSQYWLAERYHCKPDSEGFQRTKMHVFIEPVAHQQDHRGDVP